MLLQILRDEFKQRISRNPQYSLRAFAKSLKIHSSTLSGILNGKRRITPTQAQKILRELDIDRTEKKRILLQLIEGKIESRPTAYETLDEDTLDVVGGWEHFALMACLDLYPKGRTASQLAEKMKLPLAQAQTALDRLLKLSLAQVEDGIWKPTGRYFTTTQDVPSESLRQAHREYIEKALASLDQHALQDRDISGITMAISSKKLPQAKKMIKNFRRELVDLLDGDPMDEVYRLNIQLFPLSK